MKMERIVVKITGSGATTESGAAKLGAETKSGVTSIGTTIRRVQHPKTLKRASWRRRDDLRVSRGGLLAYNDSNNQGSKTIGESYSKKTRKLWFPLRARSLKMVIIRC